MKLITRDTDYAVKALCAMAKAKRKIISVEELASETKIPKPFLRRILQMLNNKRIIKSYKGKGGGFSLLKHPGQIGLTDVIIIFQGDIRLVEHVFKKKKCPQIKGCSLKKKIDVIEKDLVAQLELITIDSLLH